MDLDKMHLYKCFLDPSSSPFAAKPVVLCSSEWQHNAHSIYWRTSDGPTDIRAMPCHIVHPKALQ